MPDFWSAPPVERETSLHGVQAVYNPERVVKLGGAAKTGGNNANQNAVVQTSNLQHAARS